ncbi:MAG: 4'-phosphopantetheinyl transferase superfamily protein [Bacteroidales bacterium]|nr:4'-phosphopantetheinyl transferase superfamily protein [Bacteroidales bacterium]
MPLHTYTHVNEHASLAVWKIEEPVDWFLSQLELDAEEQKKYIEFRTDQRRVHWLAYRFILKNVVGKGNNIRVRYDENNKPFIDLSDDHISVSHSGEYATVIISRRYPVGIDIEKVSPRLYRIADKFLSDEETGTSILHMPAEGLCLHWCAKEALYKLYGKRQLDFREHMRIIDPPRGVEGSFRGLIMNGGEDYYYDLFSRQIDDYCLVYAIGKTYR